MIGWPNHPGRPELFSHSSFSNGFRLVVKIHPPDYWGGLPDDRMSYDIYLADSDGPDGPIFDGIFHAFTLSPNITVNLTISSTNLKLLGGITSPVNTYYVTTQLAYIKAVTASINAFWKDVLALPTGSPPLIIKTPCELIG